MDTRLPLLGAHGGARGGGHLRRAAQLSGRVWSQCYRSIGASLRRGLLHGLLNSQSDNNVKLIVLERLAELKKRHSKVLQEVLMDILRALASPNIDICQKTLAVAIDLVSPRNIEEVVQVSQLLRVLQ